MKHMYIRVPDELHARVKKRASDTGVSMNQIVVDALNLWANSLFLSAQISDDNGKITIGVSKWQLQEACERMNDE